MRSTLITLFILGFTTAPIMATEAVEESPVYQHPRCVGKITKTYFQGGGARNEYFNVDLEPISAYELKAELEDAVFYVFPNFSGNSFVLPVSYGLAIIKSINPEVEQGPGFYSSVQSRPEASGYMRSIFHDFSQRSPHINYKIECYGVQSQ